MKAHALGAASWMFVLMLLGGCDRFTSADTRMARANAHLEAGEYQAAIIELHKTLDSHPRDVKAQLLLVDVLTAAGETQSARVQLDRAVANGATIQATAVRRIELLLSLGEVQAVQQALDASTTLSASERGVFQGQLLLLQNKPAEALTAYENVLRTDPASIDAALGRAEAIATQGRSSEAMQIVNALLTREPKFGPAWILKGSLAVQQGDFATATDAFTAAIENGRRLKREQLLQAHAQLIESLVALGKLDAARSSLNSLESAANGSIIVSLMRAKLALAEKNPTVAVNELRKFTQAAPGYLPGRLLLASALLAQGSTEQAFSEAVRNVAEFDNNDASRLSLAGIEARLGRLSDAEQTLRPLLVRSPPNSLAVAMLAELRIRQGEAVAAVSLLEESVAQKPNDPELRLQLAAAYLSIGEAKRAIDTLNTVTTDQLSTPRDRLRVIATAALNSSATVEKELDAAISRHPEDVDLLLMAAAFQASNQRMDRARVYIEQARSMRHGDANLALSLGRLELAAGRPAEAETLAKEALAKVPNDAAAMTLMASIAAQREQESEVDAWLNRARVASPDALYVRIALARRAVARGDLAEARNTLTEAVRNSPKDPTARIALAEFNAGTGQYAVALENLRDAAQGKPDSPLILLAMAKVQLATKDSVAARKNLEHALELTPGWLPAATVLAALEVKEDHVPAALEVVREVRRIDPNSAASYALEADVYLAAKQTAKAAAAIATAYRRAPSAVLAAKAARVKLAAKMSAPEAELVDWLARMPTDTVARRTLAEFNMAAGQNAAAIANLEQVIVERPRDAVALNNLAWLYQQSNDSRALSIAENAHAAAPGVATIADTYGWILVNRGHLKKGTEILEQAAKLAPGNGEIQYHFAAALAQSGERSRARQVLDVALASLDNRSTARAAAEELHIELK